MSSSLHYGGSFPLPPLSAFSSLHSSSQAALTSGATYSGYGQSNGGEETKEQYQHNGVSSVPMPSLSIPPATPPYPYNLSSSYPPPFMMGEQNGRSFHRNEPNFYPSRNIEPAQPWDRQSHGMPPEGPGQYPRMMYPPPWQNNFNGPTNNRPRQPKPKRPRMSLQKRLLVNARERDRMRVLNKAFESLRDALPCYIADGHMAKITTLRLAINYIKALTDLLNEQKVIGNKTGVMRKERSHEEIFSTILKDSKVDGVKPVLKNLDERLAIPTLTHQHHPEIFDNFPQVMQYY